MRAVRMSTSDLNKFVDDIAAQAKNIKKTIIEIATYSNGAILLEDLYNMTLVDIKQTEQIVSEKLKSDRNIKGKEYL